MKNVVGLFDSRDEATRAIERLKAGGVGPDSISIAMKEPQDALDGSEPTGSDDLSTEGATAGVISGAAVGTLVGLALVGSTIVLPGVGTFLIGGPLAAALAGAGIGATSGGLLGGLIGSGIPEHEAGHFATALEAGSILVSIHVPDDEALTAARILDEEGSRRTLTG
jgi:hypothetical protein